MRSHERSDMAHTIYITFIDAGNNRHWVPVPLGNNQTLFEVFQKLNASLMCYCTYLIKIDCRFVVVHGAEKLPVRQIPESTLIKRFYQACDSTRIACQIPLAENMNGLVIRVHWKIRSG